MRVSLSRKTAQALASISDSIPLDVSQLRALEEVRLQLHRRGSTGRNGSGSIERGAALKHPPAGLYSKPAKRQRLAVKKLKRETKKEETSAIYAAVEKRADGSCEACGWGFCPSNPAEMDHQFGRGRARQSVRNCWMLCRTCHFRKGRSEPGPALWIELFIRHADKHGYRVEAAKAADRSVFVSARGALQQGAR